MLFYKVSWYFTETVLVRDYYKKILARSGGHAYNPSYSGGRDWEDCSSGQSGEKKLVRHPSQQISKT
jgi:hypothetical protein